MDSSAATSLLETVSDWVEERYGRVVAWCVVSGLILLLFAGLAGDPGTGPASFRTAWIPSLGVDLHLRGDPFGLFFATLVTGIGALVSLYSLAYLHAEPASHLRRFYSALATFMGAMVGIAMLASGVPVLMWARRRAAEAV